MHHAIKTIIVVLLGSLVLAAVGAGPVEASSGACGVKAAKRAAVQAQRAYVRAAKRDREARRVLKATRQITAAYSRNGFTKADGVRIGRWVQLVRRSGFRWSQVGTVVAIFARESRGSRTAKNPSSTASGLCQWLLFWTNGGSDYGWVFDPFNAKQCIKYMERCVNHTASRWSPWNPVPAPRWAPSW